MKHNKNYFVVYNTIIVVNDGTGLVIKNMSLRYILGYLYDKYNAFSIKLEGFVGRNANFNGQIENEYLLFHLDGLPFMNGFDTCTNYRNTRVVEMIHFTQDNLRGYNFISNCNGVNFWKPSTEKIDFKTFFTKVSDESVLALNDEIACIFSITGLEAYKVIHPTRDVIIPRFPTTKTVNFTLSTYKGTSIDSRNRAFIFKNVNLRQIIGSDYDKYKKFVLITKAYGLSEWNGTGYCNAFSGFAAGNIMISGFSWYRPSLAEYYGKGSSAQQIEMSTIHPTPACMACQVSYPQNPNPASSLVFKETYIENVFEKSQDVIDITISNTQIYGYILVPVNTTNSHLFPHYTFNFDIVPLDEY
jgi:hypothetical protein